MNNVDFKCPEYKRIRKAYVTQCTVEHLVYLMTIDAFLAKLLSYLNFSDALIGVITSFTSVAFLFQLFSILLVQTRISTKKIVVTLDVISQLSFLIIYCIPFIPLSGDVKRIAVVLFVILGQIGRKVIESLYFKWANAYVDPSVRATFSARKEMISLFCGIIFSTTVGYFVDRFEGLDNMRGAFIFISSVMLVLNIINFVSFLIIKDEDPDERIQMRVPLKEVLAHIRDNKIYRNYVIITIYNALYGSFLGGFLGIYKVKELAMSMLLIQIVGVVADFTRMGVSIPIAKFSNKYGFASGMQLASLLSLAARVIIVFTAPKTWYLIIPYTLLTSAAAAGSTQNSFNINYTLLPTKYMSQAMAIQHAICGIASAVSILLAGNIFDTVQKSGIAIFGIDLYPQQFMAIITIPFMISAIILKHIFVVRPLKKIYSKA